MPQHWKTYKLGDLISINSNNLKRGQYDWINYIDIKSVSSGTYGDPTFYEIGSEPSRAKRVLKVGDTVISSVRPNLKAFFYCQNLPENAIASTGFAVLSPNKIDPRFLYYLTTNDNYTEYLVKSCTGSAYPAFNPSVILDSIVTIPESIEEQRAIASILSALDEKIELNLQMNKTLEEMAMALYKHWFVDFGPFKDGKFVESELGMIPEGWEVRKLGEFLEHQKGFAFKSEWYQENGKLVVRVSDTTENSININSCNRVSSERFDLLERYALNTNDIIIATVGSWPPNYSSVVGKVVKVPPIANGSLLNQNAVRLKMKIGNSYQQGFLYSILKNDRFLKYIVNCAQGSANQASIKLNDIFNYSIPIIMNTEFNDYFEKTDSILDIQNSLTQENQILSDLRDSLLPKLISGEVTIKFEYHET